MLLLLLTVFFFMFKNKWFLVINLVFISFIFIIGFWPQVFSQKITTQDLAFYNNQNITIQGRICEETEADVKSQRLTLCAHGRALITTNLYPLYNYGDFIEVQGYLQSPPLFDDFDYGDYLARYHIYSVIYYPKIRLIKGTLNFPQKIFKDLLRLKWYLKNLIDRNLPEPEAGLANALLLGYRRTVDRNNLEIFSRVGISHMIAISGSHITIMSAMIISLFLGLGFPKKIALIFVFIFLFFYPLITGLSASAVRSAIMGGLAFGAIYLGRKDFLINSLIFSAAIMLLFNPRILRSDIGFQLSFLAIIGIIYLYPLGDRITVYLISRARNRFRKILRSVLDIINLTLVSQIIILPILLVNFKQFSLMAPLTNILILWTFPPLLASLIIALFLSSLIPALSLLWFWPAYLLLKYIFTLSRLLAQPSWAAIQINNFNWWWGGGYYLILILGYWFLTKFKKNNRIKGQ